MIYIVLTILLALQVKHFVADFLFQGPYMWKNKGTYGHPGGIWHAGFHGSLTLLILLRFMNAPVAVFVAAAETIVHYHIDWAKMNLNAHFGWKCNEHEQFWQLLGLDQLLHQICYVAILLVFVAAQ